MTIIFTSSAGRLLAESKRISAALINCGDQPLFNALAPAFEVEGREWMAGFKAFHRLTEQSLLALARIEHPGRQRFVHAVETVAEIYSPTQFGANSRIFAQGHFSEVILERLQSADDVLQLKGQAEGFDEDHAAMTFAGIDDVLSSLASEPESAVSNFVREKLLELRFVLEQFVSYGPEGLRDAVARLIGATAMWRSATEHVAPQTHEVIAKVYEVAKTALSVAVWSKETVEALTWAGTALHLLPPS